MPYMGYYGIDMYYIVLVLPCVLFAFWAQSQVNGTFNRYSRVMSRRGLTGAQAACERRDGRQHRICRRKADRPF